jgi:hypothetical protein
VVEALVDDGDEMSGLVAEGDGDLDTVPATPADRA